MKDVLIFFPEKKTPLIIYRQTREEQRYLQIPRSAYEERKARNEARINKVLEYIHAEHTCRTRILLNYFGEKTDKDCGTCDICVAKHESGIHNAEYKAIRKAIEELVKDKAMPVIQLSESLPFPQDKVLTVIRFLADHDEHFRLKDNQLAGV